MERRFRILLLEYEPTLRGVLAMILSGQGYRVVAGGSLEDGDMLLRLLGWDWPDAVLCDAHLGYEPDVLRGPLFHARWRARHPARPFIFLGGDCFTDRPLGEVDGAFHILKPFAPSDLLQLICTVLAQ
jgi:DNA-binding response OmpR family regulator